MAHTTILRPRSASQADPIPSRSVFARSWVVPGLAPLPQVAVQATPRVITLPPLSDTVVRAAALANDPDASLADFAALVQSDPAVTALLMKRANSAATGAVTTDVRQAVTLLGLKACSQLAASVGMRDLLRNAPPAVAHRCEAILRHSLLVAHLAARLHRAAGGIGSGGEEFVGGLLHDIGRVLLAMTRPDEAAAADALDFDEPADLLVRERAMLNTDHCATGAEFASASRLSPSLVRVILKHHAPFEEAGEHRRLVALVAVADHLANHVQRTRRVADYEPWSGFGYGVLCERWPAERHDQFRDAIPTAVVAAVRETRYTLRDAAE